MQMKQNWRKRADESHESANNSRYDQHKHIERTKRAWTLRKN